MNNTQHTLPLTNDLSYLTFKYSKNTKYSPENIIIEEYRNSGAFIRFNLDCPKASQRHIPGSIKNIKVFYRVNKFNI